MLSFNSSVKDIQYYINQLKTLKMSEEESSVIEKVMSLEKIINDEKVKDLIAEDLQDDSWIDATNVLIRTCLKRNNRTLVLAKHISMCENFLVFKMLEDKLKQSKSLIIECKDKKWLIKEDSDKVWSNPKFMDFFIKSSWPNVLIGFKSESIEVNQIWLNKNQEIFFSEDVFKDVGFLIKKEEKKMDFKS